MKQAVWGLSVLLSLAVPAGVTYAQEEATPSMTDLSANQASTAPSASQATSDVVDDREASFLRPPASILPLPEPAAKTEPVVEVPEAAAAPVAAAKVQPEAQVAPAAASNINKQSSPPLTTPPPMKQKAAKPVANVAAEASVVTAKAAPMPPIKPVVIEAPVAASGTDLPPPVVVEGTASVAASSGASSVQPEAPVVVPSAGGATPSPPAAVVPTTVPASIATPVAATSLADIDPESIGLLSASNGGLGASLWKETSRLLVDRLMPSVGLPTASATMNELARRLFMSTAAPPALAGGEKPSRSLLAQRLEALMALGAVTEAWKMAAQADPRLVDPVTLRQLTEAALIGPDSKEICDKIPSLMAAHAKTAESGNEWQKSLLVCQLRDGDKKAVQLGIDMMRDQQEGGVRDAIFLSLLSKNALGGSDKLPRQMTPLKPSVLAVLRQLNLPLASELYVRADAVLIPELLKTKAVDEKARLELAERAAGQGLLTAAQLGVAYQSVPFKPQELEDAAGLLDVSSVSRAKAYQAALMAADPSKKVELVQKGMTGLDDVTLAGNHAILLSGLLDSVPVTVAQGAFASQAARLYALAGQPDKATAWLGIAHGATAQEVIKSLTQNWPLFALSGLVPDADYAAGFKGWFTSVRPVEADDGNAQYNKREKAGKVMLLLSAAGYGVPEEGWIEVIEGGPLVRQYDPSPVLLERMRQAASAGRKGEAVLLGLSMVGSGKEDVPFGLWVELVRALRLVGLQVESRALAREILLRLSLL